jgi:hypothetical protein
MSEVQAPIVIEQGVPLPQRNVGRTTVYPFGALNVGDSFFVANRTTKDFASTIAAARKRMDGVKFTTRSEQNERGSGIRVWRTE